MSLGVDLARFGINTAEKMDRVYRLSAFDLFSAIIISTPVDKSVLRNNWFVGVGSPVTSKTLESKEGQEVINRAESDLAFADISSTTFFTNNLDYAEIIEFDGHSGKAPNGMVRVNTIRWDSIVKSNARRVHNGG